MFQLNKQHREALLHQLEKAKEKLELINEALINNEIDY